MAANRQYDHKFKEVLIKVPPISKDISTGLEVNIL